MDDDRPCCAASAARKVWIDGQAVGLAQSDDTILRASSMDLGIEEDIDRAMLKEMKVFYYISSSKELGYRVAIMKECVRRKKYGN